MDYLALTALLGLFAALLICLRRRGPEQRPSIASLLTGRTGRADWVEVRGRARAAVGASKHAPISGRECLGWAVIVEGESGLSGWHTLVDEAEFGDFELEDESGSIPVRAAASPIVLDVAERRGHGGPFSPPPAAVERLIARAGEPSHGVLFHKGYRWREWVLVDGREVLIRGRVVCEPGDEGIGYRRLSEIRALAGGAARPLEVAE